MLTVTITFCDGSGRQIVSRHRDSYPAHLVAIGDDGTHDSAPGWGAVAKAVCRQWGKAAHFHIDASISHKGGPIEGTTYGQVGAPARGNPGCSNMLTGRISVRVDE